VRPCLSLAVPYWYGSSEKVCKCMKGTKIGILGICISLLGIAFAMNNFIAICGATIGVLFSLVGCFIKER